MIHRALDGEELPASGSRMQYIRDIVRQEARLRNNKYHQSASRTANGIVEGQTVEWVQVPQYDPSVSKNEYGY